MLIAATCGTFAAMIAYASGGDTIALTGNCGTIEIARAFPSTVYVDATKATVQGLRISGSRVHWRGGRISAPGGMDAIALPGYAVKISGTQIRITSATITNARKGMVIDGARSILVDRNHFWRLREDGIIASRTTKLTVSFNKFSESRPLPTKCIGTDGTIVYGLASRDCAGIWIDGNHADAVQMRDGVIDVTINDNTVSGETAGLTQMDTAGDAALQNVVIRNNSVITDGYHKITLGNCIGCAIKNNVVRKAVGSLKKAIISPGAAVRCGNFAEDEKVSDGPCPT